MALLGSVWLDPRRTRKAYRCRPFHLSSPFSRPLGLSLLLRVGLQGVAAAEPAGRVESIGPGEAPLPGQTWDRWPGRLDGVMHVGPCRRPRARRGVVLPSVGASRTPPLLNSASAAPRAEAGGGSRRPAEKPERARGPAPTATARPRSHLDERPQPRYRHAQPSLPAVLIRSLSAA